MKKIWNAEDALAAMGARLAGLMPPWLGEASIDSRSLAPGDLFFAIQGDNRDGHDFVPAAFERGAAACVVSAERAAEFAGRGALLIADDVLEGLARLGKASRARSTARIIAVTGSVGKTSTKEMLRVALEEQGATHSSIASYNNHWGVPLSLARMPAETAFGVFEVGMNHSFEILPLTAMVKPHAAVITTVEPVHLAQFPSVAAIADAKGEIFTGIEPGGAAIINRDTPYFERLLAHARASRAGSVITFGEHASADIRLARFAPKADQSCIEAHVFGKPFAYKLGSPGRHMAMNSLAVIAAVKAVGGDIALAGLALKSALPPPGRGQRSMREITGGQFALLDESYNANPASMRAAIDLLSQIATAGRGRRIAVMGDMLELGPDGGRIHAELAGAVGGSQVDLIFGCGPLTRALWDKLPPEKRGGFAGDSEALEGQVLSALRAGDAVMVKGSLGSRMGRIVSAIKQRFPERQPEPAN